MKENKYKPYQKVIVKDCGIWYPCLYSRRASGCEPYIHKVIGADGYFEDKDVLPYIGNEALLKKEVEE